MLPSLNANNPNDVRDGAGQYLSDIAPGVMTSAQLSRAFLGQTFQGPKFTHDIAIDVNGLTVLMGRPHVYVIPGVQPLDVTGRVFGYGIN